MYLVYGHAQGLLEAYCKSDVELESMRRTYEAVIVKLETDIAQLSSERDQVSKRVKSVGKTRATDEHKRMLELEDSLRILQ